MKNTLAIGIALSFFLLTSGISFANPDTIDVTHYSIHLYTIDFQNHEIDAATNLRTTTSYNNVDEIKLQLKALTVDSLFVEGLQVSNYTHTGFDLTIPLDTPINPGDTLEIRVRYHGSPYHEAWGGFHFSGTNYAFNLGVGLSEIPHNLGKTWFPCVDNFTDRAIYDIYVTVPSQLEAICGGELISRNDNGNGTHTWHWYISRTMPTYLASVAVGEYAVVRDTFQGMSSSIPIEYWMRPQDTAKVEGTFWNLKTVIGILEGAMGPYDWERVGYTSTALGAMEHAANIFIPHFTITGNTSNDELFSHELSHMWLGDKVTCASAEEMWLNEGWATFFGAYCRGWLQEENDYKENLRDRHFTVLQSCHTPSGDGDYFVLNNIPQTHTYGMTAYEKGWSVVQALRFYLGDTKFFAGLTAYVEENAFSHATSYDLRDAMSDATGVDLTGFFDNWVFNAGTPGYTIDSFTVTPSGNQYAVEVFLQQKRKGPAFIGNDNIVRLAFMDGPWHGFSDTVMFDGKTGSSVKLLDFEPKAIFIDLDEEMADATTDNFHIFTETGDYTFPKTFFKITVNEIPDSALIQAIHFWVPPDSLKESVNGLTLSDYRYWRIEGIAPEGFSATGSFYYSRNGYLDNTLIQSETDSVVILYRKNASEDWQSIPFERIGLWNIGNLIVSDMQFGEYTLAVWDTQVGTHEIITETPQPVNVYPNPSKDAFYIQYNIPGPGEISILTSSGTAVKSFEVKDQGIVEWIPENLPGGTYFVRIHSIDNIVTDTLQIVYIR